jgi:methionyl-tRNA formyltransferase
VPLKIWRAEAVSSVSSHPPGQILEADGHPGIAVACGTGVLRLMELQKPGGKRLPVAEFLKGFAMDGARFE